MTARRRLRSCWTSPKSVHMRLWVCPSTPTPSTVSGRVSKCQYKNSEKSETGKSQGVENIRAELLKMEKGKQHSSQSRVRRVGRQNSGDRRESHLSFHNLRLQELLHNQPDQSSQQNHAQSNFNQLNSTTGEILVIVHLTGLNYYGLLKQFFPPDINVYVFAM